LLFNGLPKPSSAEAPLGDHPSDSHLQSSYLGERITNVGDGLPH
jgi:hypothetical protein